MPGSLFIFICNFVDGEVYDQIPFFRCFMPSRLALQKIVLKVQLLRYHLEACCLAQRLPIHFSILLVRFGAW
jgi:hypothetical protein